MIDSNACTCGKVPGIIWPIGGADANSEMLKGTFGRYDHDPSTVIA